MSDLTARYDVLRDILATILNQLPERSWQAIIQKMPLYHIDLEDETMFSRQLNELIAEAAKQLSATSTVVPTDFDEFVQAVASKIPDMQASHEDAAKSAAAFLGIE